MIDQASALAGVGPFTEEQKKLMLDGLNDQRGAAAPKPPKIDDGDHDDIGGPGTSVSLTFLAAHYQDAKLEAFAWAYQQATGFHKLHPKLD
jgi:hypothetical protein